MIEFELNNDSINYEVALEILGQERQPFMRAILEEQAKAAPSQPLINYCKTRLTALDELQDALRPGDKETVERILNKDDPIFLRRPS
jgi:hypothetical protein